MNEVDMQRAVDIAECAEVLIEEATGGSFAEFVAYLLDAAPEVGTLLLTTAEAYFPAFEGDMSAAFMCGIAYGVAAGRTS